MFVVTVDHKTCHTQRIQLKKINRNRLFVWQVFTAKHDTERKYWSVVKRQGAVSELIKAEVLELHGCAIF